MSNFPNLPARLVDVLNTRTLANLGIAGVWPGAARLTDQYARFDLEIEAVAIGTLYLLQGDSEAALNAYDPAAGAPPAGITRETWPVPALTPAGTIFGTKLKKSWYRAHYVQGAAAGNVGITSTLDARALDVDTPLLVVDNLNVASLAFFNITAPLGARTFTMRQRQSELLVEPATGVQTAVNALLPNGYSCVVNGKFSDVARSPLEPGAVVYCGNNSPVEIDVKHWFYEG